MTLLAVIDRWIGWALRSAAMVCFVGLFLLLFVNVAARTFRIAGIAWFDEIVQGLFAWMVFIGAAALWRERDHFQVDWLPRALPSLPSRLLRGFSTLLSIAFLVALTWYGADLTVRATALTPILDLPVSLFYAAIPIAGAIMLIYSIADLIGLAVRAKDPCSDRLGRSPSPPTDGRF